MGRKSSKEVILDAAFELVEEVGYDGATIDAIIARAGIARGTFYYNFKSKEAVIVALARHKFRPLAERVEAKLESGASPLDALEVMVGQTMQWNLDHPHFAEALIRCSQTELGKSLPPDPNNPASFRSFVAGLIARGQEEGSICNDTPAQMLAVMLTSLLLHGIAAWLYAPTKPDLQVWGQKALQLFWEGCRK